MKRIGLIADTHSYLDDAVLRHFEPCDEVWHAGDFGTLGVANVLKTFRPFRGVFGNIDSPEIRHEYPETLTFQCEEVGVLMTHIGGYPGKYAPAIKPLLHTTRPKLFICGHSHILKVMYDTKLECLQINPGAAGKSGWHKVRTIMRLVIDGNQMRDCEVIELGAR